MLSLTLHEVTFRLYRVRWYAYRINCFHKLVMPHDTSYMKPVALNRFL